MSILEECKGSLWYPGTFSSLVPAGLGGKSGMSESTVEDLLHIAMDLSKPGSSLTVPSDTLQFFQKNYHTFGDETLKILNNSIIFTDQLHQQSLYFLSCNILM